MYKKQLALDAPLPAPAPAAVPLPTIDVRRIVSLYQGHPLLAEVSVTPVVGGLQLLFTLPNPGDEKTPDTAAAVSGGLDQ